MYQDLSGKSPLPIIIAKNDKHCSSFAVLCPISASAASLAFCPRKIFACTGNCHCILKNKKTPLKLKSVQLFIPTAAFMPVWNLPGVKGRGAISAQTDRHQCHMLPVIGTQTLTIKQGVQIVEMMSHVDVKRTPPKKLNARWQRPVTSQRLWDPFHHCTGIP